LQITVFLPAHNEQASIATAISSVLDQTVSAHKIVVVADNCTDQTADIAAAQGAEVFVTTNNVHKKGGALNQALAHYLPLMSDDDNVFIMDADSFLDRNFFATAVQRLETRGVKKAALGRYGGIGGTFSGRDGGGFVGWLQRNEYARYARDVRRRKGRVLVLTGTATMYSVEALRAVHSARLEGSLPGHGYVYDTRVLTEDNELTFALLHLGYGIRSPKQCTLSTEVMTTWDDLYQQRLRWKRGALENCMQYGLTKHTLGYWFRQVWTGLGVFVITAYLLSIIWSFMAFGGVVLHPLWMSVTTLFAVERVVSVRKRGWLAMVVASVILVEMTFDLFLQCIHGKAVWDMATRRERVW
jgi:cellulose synthase/poly-beta-1,6-N-acetylglucosamine synthase-like glycosyltransferase